MEGDLARATDAVVEEEAVEALGLLPVGFFAGLVLAALVVGVALDVGAEVVAGAAATVVGVALDVGAEVVAGAAATVVGIVVVAVLVVIGGDFPETAVSSIAVPSADSGISIVAVEAGFSVEIVVEAPAEGSADEVAIGAVGTVAPPMDLALGLVSATVRGANMPTARAIVSEVDPLGVFPTQPSLAVARQAMDAPIPRATSAIDCATDTKVPALAPRSAAAVLGAPPLEGFVVPMNGDEDASAVDVPWLEAEAWPPAVTVARPAGVVALSAAVVSSRVVVDAPGIAPRQTVSVLVAVSPIALSDSSESPSLRVLAAASIEAPAEPLDAPLALGESDPSEALGTTPVGVGSVDALDTSVSRLETTSWARCDRSAG